MTPKPTPPDTRTTDVFVDGIVRGTSDGVGGLGTVVRTAQSGFVRFYALLVVVGLAGLGLYFLLAAS